MTEDDFHISRSRYLNAIAKIEEQIVRLMQISELKVEKIGLGLNLRSLKTVKASPRLSKNHVAQLTGIVDEIALILEERADIVHGQLRIVKLDGQPYALFRNPQNIRRDGSETVRLISGEQFAQSTSRADSISADLKKIGQPTKEKAPQHSGAPTVIPIASKARST